MRIEEIQDLADGFKGLRNFPEDDIGKAFAGQFLPL
jgi:hypothetical protein